MKKPLPTTPTDNSPMGCRDERFAKKFPRLIEYLSEESWEDGTARETSTISLFVESGCIKLALNDRALRRSAYLTADTLEDAFKGLEACLERSSLDWRAWGARTKKK